MNADLRTLLAHARHELRTPVNAIIGYGEMLLEDAEAGGRDDLAEPLQSVLAQGKSLQNLIGDLLDGSLADREEDLDLSLLIDQVRAALRPPCQRVRDLCAFLVNRPDV